MEYIISEICLWFKGFNRNVFNCFICFFFFLPQAACQAAAAYCKEKGKNISKLAMQYSLSNKEISSVLVGMNSVRQVDLSFP